MQICICTHTHTHTHTNTRTHSYTDAYIYVVYVLVWREMHLILREETTGYTTLDPKIVERAV